MTGGAARAFQGFRICISSKNGRNPVAMFHPRICSTKNAGIFANHMQQLGPEPFRRINTTFEFGKVDRPFSCQLINFIGFFNTCMVFPEHKHGIRVFFESGSQRERCAFFVNSDWCRASGVDGNTHYVFGHACRSFFQRFNNGEFHSFEIIFRVLAKLVVGRIAVHAFFPARIFKNYAGYFFSVFNVHDERTNRIGTVIEPDGVFCLCHFYVVKSLMFKV